MTRKKADPIKTLGKDTDKLTVQKSLPLFELWRSELTLAEFKILDTYLSRINSHNSEKRVVVFSKGELEEKLGVKKINKTDLIKRLTHLMGNVVRVPDKDMKKGFRLVTLFEEADADVNDDGLWEVKLECTQKAMKYFFNIDNLGYLRYKLRCITSIKSRYTYILFTYLEQNRFRKSFDVELDELKQILGCDDETYQEFKFFNQKILKRSYREIHEKTECRFEYKPVKKGRSVVGVHFEIETLSDKIASADDMETNQISIDDYEKIKAEMPESQSFLEPLACFGFSREQLDELSALAKTLPISDDGELYYYFDAKAKEMIRRDAEKKIRSKLGYLRKLMMEDAKNQKSAAVGRRTVALASDRGTDYDAGVLDDLLGYAKKRRP